jgi:hypothetical protein
MQQWQLDGGGSGGGLAVAAAQWQRRRQLGGSGCGGSLAAAAARAGGLVMVRLLMDVFIDAQVDVLLVGHISVQIPTNVGDECELTNQNKNW